METFIRLILANFTLTFLVLGLRAALLVAATAPADQRHGYRRPVRSVFVLLDRDLVLLQLRCSSPPYPTSIH
jgi:hypothetical protein